MSHYFWSCYSKLFAVINLCFGAVPTSRSNFCFSKKTIESIDVALAATSNLLALSSVIDVFCNLSEHYFLSFKYLLCSGSGIGSHLCHSPFADSQYFYNHKSNSAITGVMLEMDHKYLSGAVSEFQSIIHKIACISRKASDLL